MVPVQTAAHRRAPRSPVLTTWWTPTSRKSATTRTGASQPDDDITVPDRICPGRHLFLLAEIDQRFARLAQCASTGIRARWAQAGVTDSAAWPNAIFTRFLASPRTAMTRR